MKRTYIAAALLACAAAPAIAAEYYYYPASGTTVVTPAPTAAVTPAPAAPVQYIHQDQASIVSVVQTRLRAEGYSVPVNGVFDSYTSDALKDFQRRHGLAATGAIDHSTMASMGISSSTPVAVASVPVYVATSRPVIITSKPDSLPRNYEGSISDNLGGLGFDRSNVRWAENY
jgi:peptidoglycan hydrolase-like protein with peptidoglycan-binding domain